LTAGLVRLIVRRTNNATSPAVNAQQSTHNGQLKEN
jgi:hypothetical protein